MGKQTKKKKTSTEKQRDLAEEGIHRIVKGSEILKGNDSSNNVLRGGLVYILFGSRKAKKKLGRAEN